MRISIVVLCSLLVAGCAISTPLQDNPSVIITERTVVPPPKDGAVIVAIYGFGDKTGQRKDSGNVAKLSSAVTQGAETILIESLKEAGDRKWFRVVERVGLDNLIKERQLIRSSREDAKDESALRPLLYAGVIIEGGIVSYDTSITSGGAGARWLGIGVNTTYSQDLVTVSLRLVSVQTGEILLSVTTQKTILGVDIGQDTFKFLDMGTKLLETEVGHAENEATVYAVKKAIDAAVLELILKGERLNYWKFKETEKVEENEE
jgi:curli production assembly/transport component CsgG